MGNPRRPRLLSKSLPRPESRVVSMQQFALDRSIAHIYITFSARPSSVAPSLTPPLPLSVGPRLLTGKISSSVSKLTSAPGQPATSSPGWGRPSPPISMPAGQAREGPPSGMMRGRLFEPPRSMSSGRGGAVWGRGPPLGSHGHGSWAGHEQHGDFPSVAEAARGEVHGPYSAIRLALMGLVPVCLAKKLRAAQGALHEKVASAALAAHNQHLLEGLEAFRGVHLDPNASHWDEVSIEFLPDSLCNVELTHLHVPDGRRG
jgi:hypothetical protein